MPAIFPSINIDKDSLLAEIFLPYQISWIRAEDPFHERKQQVFALAEKSVRIGWTYADAFKNVRKRLRFKNRDYLFATKDYPSALEYMRIAKQFTELYKLTKTIVSHGEDYLKVPRAGITLPSAGSALPRAGSILTDEIKISYIKFDNGSRIIAFSAHPQAMAVYGGDVGLDEFAKHPNAELLWQTAQGRVTWGYDMAVWSSHEGDDTLFHQFAQQARLSSIASATEHASLLNPSLSSSSSSSFSSSNSSRNKEHAARPSHPSTGSPASESSPPVENQKSKIENSSTPWNLYFRVTITDAIELGLLTIINRTRNTKLTPDQFIADCRARAGLDQIFQQAYMCNPVPAGASIVDWSAIERCRSDYDIIRVHLEHSQIIQQFGDFNPDTEDSRSDDISSFIKRTFLPLFSSSPLNLNRNPNLNPSSSPLPIRLGEGSGVRVPSFRLGFDVAASGQGDLAVFYIDEVKSDDLWLRALLTCRTEDWHFLQTVLFKFLRELPRLQAAGDATGLGREICWDASKRFGGKFTPVNFASKKNDLGFALMNQLATAQKRFPQAHHDIAADFFALRKTFQGTRWLFTEGRNHLNPVSHCDIAWAGALATHAHTENKCEVRAYVVHENGWFDGRDFHFSKS